MKPYENFVENMMNAVRSGQGKDPAAVTALIQETLRNAGLMPGGAQAPGASAAPDAAKAFVDLNSAPSWAQKRAGKAPGAGGAARPAGGAGFADAAGFGNMAGVSGTAGAAGAAGAAGRFGDWAARFAPQPGTGAGAGLGRRPAAPDLPGEFLHGSFTCAAGTRPYRLYVPSRPATGPRPLVVMLHGCKQDAADFAAGTAMNRLGEDGDCLVLYPEQERGANSSNCWNWFETAHQARDAGEPSIIAGMTRQVIGEQGADPRRVYVAGLSAGGAMAAVMGATYPELYAAVGVHSGLPVGAARDLMSGLNAMKGAAKGKRATALRRPVPLIVFHGDQDHFVHASNGAALFHQFAQDDAGAPLRQTEARADDGGQRGATCTTALDAAGRVAAEYWVVHGAGHAWAGGDPAGSYVDASGPDASAEMLRFFLTQTAH